MKLTVDTAALRDQLIWAAGHAALTGLLLTAGDDGLTVSAFDSEASRRATIVDSDVDGCTFRMLDPDTEIKRAMAFPPGYLLFGNRGDRTAQLGNAVTPNCSALVSHRLAQAILGERTA